MFMFFPGATSFVTNPEELGGAREEETHHADMTGEAGEVEGGVAGRGAAGRHLHPGLVKHRPHHVLAAGVTSQV